MGYLKTTHSQLEVFRPRSLYNLLTSNIGHKADGGRLYTSLIVSGEGTAEEHVDFYQVLLSINNQVSDKSLVWRHEKVLPVLWLGAVAECRDWRLSVPLSPAFLTVKKSRVHLKTKNVIQRLSFFFSLLRFKGGWSKYVHLINLSRNLFLKLESDMVVQIVGYFTSRVSLLKGMNWSNLFI